MAADFAPLRLRPTISAHRTVRKATMGTVRLVFAVTSFALLVLAAQLFGNRTAYFPNVVVDVPGDLHITFLRNARPTIESCQLASLAIVNSVTATCPGCKLRLQACSVDSDGAFKRNLGENPLGMPSARIPDGVVVYASDNAETAMSSCRETERLANQVHGQRVNCYAPNTVRPVTSTAFTSAHLLLGAIAVGAALLVSLFAGFLIVRYQAVHGRWSHDGVKIGPQKFHAAPTPRIGGLCLMAALFVAQMLLPAGNDNVAELFGYLVLASLPAFAAGLTEDITKNVGVVVRFVVTMASATLGVIFLDAVLGRLDVAGFDRLLLWHPFAVAFTIFAVGGVTNALNIIDGYNGLAAGYSVIALFALAIVCALVGDAFLLWAVLTMAAALIGFLAWNYPKGKIFLGDSGAYLVGFWLAEISVLLVVRHSQISPWFPMLLMVYPVFETVFSMYRRKILRGSSPGHPDRLHMHQVIYMRLVRRFVGTSDATQITHRNSLVAPYIWAINVVVALLAVICRENTMLLVGFSAGFCVFYLRLYVTLVNWRAPAWLIRGHTR
jgi:UDP-GlcNAc:undecaprenyl-phosphate/decaprenyl-phosphate GlcNAc-1-phosphate transferase